MPPAWITVDDTGARHKATNGFCTQIGNAHFTWFGTTVSNSRLNFLGREVSEALDLYALADFLTRSPEHPYIALFTVLSGALP